MPRQATTTPPEPAVRRKRPRRAKATPKNARRKPQAELLVIADADLHSDPEAFDQADEKIARDAVLADPDALALYLQEHLGQRLTAYLAGLNNGRMVGEWSRGKAAPPALTRERLRVAYQATRLFLLRYSDQAAQGWFFGANATLDQRAPASVLRDAQSPDELALIVPLVRAFMRGAH
jgi:hypothetical protein